MLQIKNLTVCYEKKYILKDFNLKVLPGQLVGIIGPNGTGKSTLLKTISGEVAAKTGEINLNGIDITNYPMCKRAQNIAQILQDPIAGTIGQMTIAENLSLGLKRGEARYLIPYKISKRKILFKERLSLLKMRLENRLDDLVSDLSGGQRQALSLIIATMVPTRLLLLDEITSALDPIMAKRVMELTQTLVHLFNCPALFITHDLDEAKNYADSIVELKPTSQTS